MRTGRLPLFGKRLAARHAELAALRNLDPAMGADGFLLIGKGLAARQAEFAFLRHLRPAMKTNHHGSSSYGLLSDNRKIKNVGNPGFHQNPAAVFSWVDGDRPPIAPRPDSPPCAGSFRLSSAMPIQRVPLPLRGFPQGRFRFPAAYLLPRFPRRGADTASPPAHATHRILPRSTGFPCGLRVGRLRAACFGSGLRPRSDGGLGVETIPFPASFRPVSRHPWPPHLGQAPDPPQVVQV